MLSEMIKFAVILPVGPGQQELDRTADLLNSLWAYEPHTHWLILVDDSKQDRQLTQRFNIPSSCKSISIINPRQGKGIGHTGGLCTALLTALYWIQKNTDVSFALKLDTDALVIAPFAEKIHTAFAAMPNVGMLGSYDKTCNGDKRDFSSWELQFKKLSSLVSISRIKSKIHLHLSFMGRSATIRKHIHAAVENGYQWGEHCLGGACAVSSKMIFQMAIKGYLEDPLLWLHTSIGDDPMMGMYTRAVGMELRGFVDRDQPFGLKLRGLADTPKELLSRGYSLIHSVKNDGRFSENEIRNFYSQCRLQVSKN